MHYCESRDVDLLSFVFFPLFASWFLFQIFTVSHPYFQFALLMLSFIGILGITWSLRREKRTWLYAVPSLVVMLLLISTISVRAAVGDPIPSGPVFWKLALGFFSNVLYLSLALAVTVLLIGLLVSGVEHAGPLAILTGLSGALTLPSIVQDLARIGDALHGIPIRTSGDPVMLLYVVMGMPIIGVLLLLAGYALSKSRAQPPG